MRAAWIVLFTCTLAARAGATPQWQALPNAPIAGRIDDIHFLDANTGWAVTAEGNIYHTADGGESWSHQLSNSSLYFRCVRFSDPLHGWTGTLDSNQLVLHTEDGGETWNNVSNIPSPRPNAVCGMWIPSSQVIYGVGSWSGPARVIKSVDGGATWSSMNLDALATTLVDVYFINDDEGFAVGSIGVFANHSRSVVLHTSDGGATWEQRYVSPRQGEWCWKISFPTPNIGYASIEKINDPMFFLKTTDAGATWTALPFPNFNEQGIGFATPLIGWVGGADNPTFGTTDGGVSWTQTPWGDYLNRFQFLSPTLGYGSGVTVYKYSESTVDVADASAPRPPVISASPNPFEPHTTIRYELDAPADVKLFVADPSGRAVRTLTEAPQDAGAYRVDWDGKDDNGRELPAGIYLYVLHAGGRHEMGKLVRVQ